MALNLSFQDDFCTSCINEQNTDVMVLKDKQALCEDLKYILSIPDLCDVLFLVGPDHRPIHGIRAVLASRSRVFYQMLLAKEKEMQKNYEPKKHGFIAKVKQIRRILKSKPTTTNTSIQTKLTITLEGYDPSVFERMIRYIHCGVVSVDALTVIGLLVAAEKFEFDCLKSACWEFAINCVRPDVVHEMISSANKYANNKTVISLLQKIQEILLENPQSRYLYSPSKDGSYRNLSDCRQRSITTNGLLMRSVL